MATRLWLWGSKTFPRAPKIIAGHAMYFDLVNAVGTRNSGTIPTALINTGTPSEMEIGTGPINNPAGNPPSTLLAWWGERLAASVTLSGTITLHIGQSGNGAHHRWRAKLYKITPGGGDLITFIASADSTADMVTDTFSDWTMTIPTPVVVGVGERLILRLWAFTTDGSALTTATRINFYGAAPTWDSYIELTETLTFTPNGTRLSFRQTTANGIGNFLDLLPTFNTTTYVMTVVNSAVISPPSEIQWTRTAGGILAEWITPRLSGPWDLPDDPINAKEVADVVIWAKNDKGSLYYIGTRAKLFVRRPDGTEIQVWGFSGDVNYLTTAAIGKNFSLNNTVQAPDFGAVSTAGEDDRLIARVYIRPSGGQPMKAGALASFGYDGPAGVNGTSEMWVYSLPSFKAESDPPKGSVVPSGGTLMGLSNGQ